MKMFNFVKIGVLYVLCSIMCVLCFKSVNVMAEDNEYATEFAKLPAEMQVLENIKLIDGDSEKVICNNLATDNNSAHLYGDAKFQGESGGSITLFFKGTTIGFICQKGAFEIYIDDEYVETVWKANDNGKMQLAYYNDSLENREHVIQVISDADTARENTPENYCVFEGFIVQDVVEPIPTPTVQPTQEPTLTPEPEKTAEVTTAEATSDVSATDVPTKEPAVTDTDGDNVEDNTVLIIVLAVLVGLIVIAAAALMIMKRKKN